jgi:hypothetical protein
MGVDVDRAHALAVDDNRLALLRRRGLPLCMRKVPEPAAGKDDPAIAPAADASNSLRLVVIGIPLSPVPRLVPGGLRLRRLSKQDVDSRDIRPLTATSCRSGSGSRPSAARGRCRTGGR